MMQRTVLGSLVALALVTLLASCSTSPQNGSVSFPKPTSGCAASSVSTPAISLGTIASVSATTLYVPVCVDGSGPYPFLLDTGASASIVDTQLAQQLKLHKSAPAQRTIGTGCTSTRSKVQVEKWSMGGMTLSPQSLLTGDLSGFGLGNTPAGILGSDVLSRFGAIRIDYRAQQLEVLAPEGTVHGGGGAEVITAAPDEPPPPSLMKATPRYQVPLTVVVFNSSTLATASVTFGGAGSSGHPFVIDSGSSVSSVTERLAASAHLQHDGTVTASNVGCGQAVDNVQSGAWSASSVSLRPQGLASITESADTLQEASGALGSDVLSRYGSIVIDYRTALLWLGAG